MKATAIAPSNIAFVKYWGRIDDALRIPTNDSISMNLSALTTTTTVEFSSRFNKDEVTIDGGIDENRYMKVIEHIDRLRKVAKSDLKAKVVSVNSFPSSTGLSSSASGFAALTLGISSALKLDLSEKQLSQYARQASGSACRSIPSGFVQWFAGDSKDTSFAKSLYSPSYWDIIDMIVIVSTQKKDVPTSDAQKFANQNPFFKTRLLHIGEKIKLCKQVLESKDFKKFGELIEQEALELHAIIMTSSPSLVYLLPETLKIMQLVRRWRDAGLPVYFTLNTGGNIHLLCQGQDKDQLVRLLKNIPEALQVIEATPARGSYISQVHLF